MSIDGGGNGSLAIIVDIRVLTESLYLYLYIRFLDQREPGCKRNLKYIMAG